MLKFSGLKKSSVLRNYFKSIVVVATVIILYCSRNNNNSMSKADQTSFFPNPKDKMGYLIWQINMLWIRKINQNLHDVGLTHTQLITLHATSWLNAEKDEVIQKDLVEAIKIDRMMISKLVSKLDDMGLIERTQSKNDTRALAIKPTKKGVEKIKNTYPLIKRLDKEFYGLMEEDQETLKKLLQKLFAKAEEHMNESKN